MTEPMPYFGNLPRFSEPALCAETDPEVFWPERGGSPQEAKRTCRRCLAQPECLTWAIDNDERWGYWAGMSEKQRARLRSRRGAA